MTPAMRVVEEEATRSGIRSADILGKSRRAEVVEVRRLVIRRLYLEKHMNTPAIAQLFNCLATSVRHHLRVSGICGCRSKMELAEGHNPLNPNL